MSWKNIFKRSNKIVEANANAVLDKVENPILMIEQSIRDMSEQFKIATSAHAKAKARAIRIKAEVTAIESELTDWNKRATAFKTKYKNSVDDIKAQELYKGHIVSCLNTIENLNNKLNATKISADKATKKSDSFGIRVKALHNNIDTAKTDLSDLRTRSELATAEKEINEQMAGVSNDSAMETINRMREKVAQEEAEAEAYGEIIDEDKSLEDEMDDLLNADSPTENNKLLDDFLND